jgi:serine/threonine protein kinase
LLFQRYLLQSNILIDQDFHPRLADFGWTRLVDEIAQGSTNMTRSLRWMAPELLDPTEGVQQTYASDIYAFACVCVEVSTFPLNFLPKLITL